MKLTQHEMRYRFPKPQAKVAVVPKAVPVPASVDAIKQALWHLAKAEDLIAMSRADVCGLEDARFQQATRQLNGLHMVEVATDYLQSMLPPPSLADKFRSSYPAAGQRIGA